MNLNFKIYLNKLLKIINIFYHNFMNWTSGKHKLNK